MKAFLLNFEQNSHRNSADYGEKISAFANADDADYKDATCTGH